MEQYEKNGQYVYLILEMEKDDQGSRSLGPEQLGSKRKFWALMEEEPRPWLFKYARRNTGEHWAEKLGAELAGRLKVPHARVELAEHEMQQGVFVESIVPHEWDKK